MSGAPSASWESAWKAAVSDAYDLDAFDKNSKEFWLVLGGLKSADVCTMDESRKWQALTRLYNGMRLREHLIPLYDNGMPKEEIFRLAGQKQLSRTIAENMLRRGFGPTEGCGGSSTAVTTPNDDARQSKPDEPDGMLPHTSPTREEVAPLTPGAKRGAPAGDDKAKRAKKA